MDILSSGKDLVLVPYGDRWRQMQRFANRELLSARNLNNVRERHIDEVQPVTRSFGDAGFVVIGVGMLLLGLRYFVHDLEPETLPELEEPACDGS